MDFGAKHQAIKIFIDPGLSDREKHRDKKKQKIKMDKISTNILDTFIFAITPLHRI